MFIKIKENDYELLTKLGTSMKIEKKFNLPIMQLFSKLGEATVDELVTIIAIAAKKTDDKEFKNDLIDEWDYLDLFNTVQDLVLKLMFSGTDEENEKKLEKFPAPEQQKNAMRVLLNLPPKETVDPQ